MAKIDPILYMQTDPRWANNDYSAPGEKTTIKAEGCGIACSAMVIASLVDKNVTPADTAKWSLSHGYKALRQGTYYSYFKPQFAAYGLKCEMLNSKNCYHDSSASCHKKAKQALEDGDWVIAVMGVGDFTSSGHYVLLYRIDGNDVLIRDPYNKKAICSKMDWDKAKYQVKYYWHIVVPEKYKEDEDMTQEKFNEMFLEMRKELQDNDAGTWSQAARDWATNSGLVAGNGTTVDGEPNCMWSDFLNREQFVTVLYRFAQMMGKA